MSKSAALLGVNTVSTTSGGANGTAAVSPLLVAATAGPATSSPTADTKLASSSHAAGTSAALKLIPTGHRVTALAPAAAKPKSISSVPIGNGRINDLALSELALEHADHTTLAQGAAEELASALARRLGAR
jgi:hypothetical protein